jgi:2'-5' RNA ligase
VVRLFVGVWPTAEACEVLASMPRPEVAGVRWTSPDRWHVTVAFLGQVTEVEVDAWTRTLRAATASLERRPEAILGPATELLGPAVLSVPVAGLEPAAEALGSAARTAGLPVDPRPFRGHLTLARARGRGRLPGDLAGEPIAARWTVAELCLVESVPGGRGEPPRYVTLSTSAIPRADGPGDHAGAAPDR